jgi:quinol monooxygenase YgiN
MVRLTVALRASSSRRAEELLETLRFLIASTRLEQGCEKCTVSVDPDFTVHYDERWATQADVRRRVRSSEFTSLLGLMECASEPPDVQFDFVTRARGLDFVAEVRAESEDPSCEDLLNTSRLEDASHET